MSKSKPKTSLLDAYGLPLVSYEGRGKLTHKDGFTVPVLFKCIQLNNSEIYIEVILLKSPQITEGVLSFRYFGGVGIDVERLEGILRDRRKFSTKNYLYLGTRQISNKVILLLMPHSIEISNSTSINLGSEVLRFYLTNLDLLGNEMLFLQGKGFRVSEVVINDHKAILYLIEGSKEIINRMKATEACSVTTNLEVETGSKSKSEVIDFANNLCILLSFAKGTLVSWTYYEELSESGRPISVYHHSTITSNFANMRLIDQHPTGELIKFLEKVYPRYLKIRDEYKLDSAIRSLCQAKLNATFGELSGLTVGVVVDVLRAEWAGKQNREFIFKDKIFKKISVAISKVIDLVSNFNGVSENQVNEFRDKIGELNRPPFRTVLMELIAAMHADITELEVKEFIKSRNSLVHEGNFKTQNPMLELFSMFYFADRLIMAFLGYRGPHLDCRG